MFYDTLLQKRQFMKLEYSKQVERQLEVDSMGFEVLDKLRDEKEPITSIVDSFVNYKVSKYKHKVETYCRRMRGQVAYSGQYDEDFVVRYYWDLDIGSFVLFQFIDAEDLAV